MCECGATVARLDEWRVAHEKSEELLRDLMNTRLERMNHLQARMDEFARAAVTRDLYDREHAVMTKRVGELENRFANLDGRMLVYSAAVAFIASIVVAGMASLVFLIVHGG